MKRLEIRISTRARAILRVDRDGSLQVGYRFGMFAALRVRNSQHVKRVVVVGVLVANESQMGNRFVVASAVDRECRGVEPFFNRLRRG